jgi:hypothetical protein
VKKLISIFLLFFAIFFVLGFYEARQWHGQPDYINLFVVSHMRLAAHGDTNYLIYGPPSGAVWILDLKRDSASFDDPMRQVAMLESSNASILAVDGSLLHTFLAGASAWTIKDVITAIKEKPSNYRNIIAAIAAGGGGFSTGYWIGNRFPPRFDDPAIIRWLSTTTDYSNIKRLSFILLFKVNRERLAMKTPDMIINEVLEGKLRRYLEAATKVRDPKYVPTNEDFTACAELR